MDALLIIQDAALLHGLSEKIASTPAVAGELTVALTTWEESETNVTQLDVFDLRRAAHIAFMFPPPFGEESPLHYTEMDDEEWTVERVPVLAQVAVASLCGLEYIHPAYGLQRSHKVAFRYTRDHAIVTDLDETGIADPIKGAFDDGYYLLAQHTLAKATPLEKLLDLADAA